MGTGTGIPVLQTSSPPSGARDHQPFIRSYKQSVQRIRKSYRVTFGKVTRSGSWSGTTEGEWDELFI
jgi:hypothetical protein